MRPQANPNRGPGDFLPPDPEELDDFYLERAREKLEASLGGDPPAERVEALAWELQDAARQPPDDLGADD